MSEAVYDVAIIGEGINGCGVARDAAGRGAASSTLTKLIHGGLHDPEYCQLKLVRAALIEREVDKLKATSIARDDRCARRLVRAYASRAEVTAEDVLWLGEWMRVQPRADAAPAA